MIRREEIIPIGKFQKTHALKGELNMISDIDVEYFKEGNPLILETDGILVPFYAETIRPKGSTSYLVKLQGVDSEEMASEFVNKEIFMLFKDSEEWLEEDPEDTEYYVGFQIVKADTGEEIGVVESVEDSTVNVLFIIKSPEGKEIYLPANQDFVEEIDEEHKLIRMNLPEGLLELNN
ncbi:MAG: 16S rRNA processing protein RimM [Muribaculaceae bacterium]|nr:16S rRNA processing protein RimM [Muribaculaceae bacterium]